MQEQHPIVTHVTVKPIIELSIVIMINAIVKMDIMIMEGLFANVLDFIIQFTIFLIKACHRTCSTC